jgi:hypothetical protein
MFVNEYGYGLPQGTVLRVPTLFDHEGIVAYDWNGQQVIIHNSKKRGVAAVTTPEEFNENVHRVVVVRIPATQQLGEIVVQRALQAAQVPARWNVLNNNCQDFVSRAYGAPNGSMTRNVVVGLVLAGGLLWALAGNQA